MLVLLVGIQLVLIGTVNSQPKDIGKTVQDNPFDSNPTAHDESGISGLSPTNAYDGRLPTAADFEYGAADGYFELSSFNNTPPTPFGISWVDIKISYGAQGIWWSDDRYRILCYVDPPHGPTPPPIILQDWVSGEDAIYDPDPDVIQGHRAWSNVTEPNDGVWDWTDIGNVRIVIEMDQIDYEDFQHIWIYEVWLTIYTGPPPPPGISVQPPGVLFLSNETIFFVEVYVRDVTKLYGYQFNLHFDNSSVLAISYFSYGPFNYGFPSEIYPDRVAISYCSYGGDMEGLTGFGPIARIYFQVVAVYGRSLLDLEPVAGGPILTDVNGDPIPVDVYDGYFRNTLLGDMCGDAPGSLPDGDVDYFDFLDFGAAYLKTIGQPGYNMLADIEPEETDGDVDYFDFLEFGANYLKSVP